MRQHKAVTTLMVSLILSVVASPTSLATQKTDQAPRQQSLDHKFDKAEKYYRQTGPTELQPLQFSLG